MAYIRVNTVSLEMCGTDSNGTTFLSGSRNDAMFETLVGLGLLILFPRKKYANTIYLFHLSSNITTFTPICPVSFRVPIVNNASDLFSMHWS